MLKIDFVTAVWGEYHTKFYIEYCLPSLNVEGNFLNINTNNDYRFSYYIYTQKAYIAQIENSLIFNILKKDIDFHFIDIEIEDFNADFYGSHSFAWQHAINRVEDPYTAVIFIIPDLIYSKGTLSFWLNKLSEGVNAIYSPGPQVIQETTTIFLERFRKDLSIEIDENEINVLILENLHPIHIGLIKGNINPIWFPEYDIETDKGRGVIIRELSANPFCIRPRCFSRLVNFNPCDNLETIYFDKVRVASVEPFLKRHEWYINTQVTDRQEFSQIANFLSYDSPFCPPACQEDARHPRTLLFSKADSLSKDTLLKSQDNIKRIEFFRELFKIMGNLEIEKCYNSIRIVSYLICENIFDYSDFEGISAIILFDDDCFNDSNLNKVYKILGCTKKSKSFFKKFIKMNNYAFINNLGDYYIKNTLDLSINQCVYILAKRQKNYDNVVSIKSKNRDHVFLYIPLINAIFLGFEQGLLFSEIERLFSRIRKSVKKRRRKVKLKLSQLLGNVLEYLGKFYSNFRSLKRIRRYKKYVQLKEQIGRIANKNIGLVAYLKAIDQIAYYNSQVMPYNIKSFSYNHLFLGTLNYITIQNKIKENLLYLIAEDRENIIDHIYALANFEFSAGNYFRAIELFEEIISNKDSQKNSYIFSRTSRSLYYLYRKYRVNGKCFFYANLSLNNDPNQYVLWYEYARFLKEQGLIFESANAYLRSFKIENVEYYKKYKGNLENLHDN